jgi:uncharacterized small protein (DUF1192 family)
MKMHLPAQERRTNSMRSKDGEGTAKERHRRRSTDKDEAEAMEHAHSLIEDSFTVIAATHERMAVTQVEIDRLKAVNRELLVRSRRLLEEIKRVA